MPICDAPQKVVSSSRPPCVLVWHASWLHGDEQDRQARSVRYGRAALAAKVRVSKQETEIDSRNARNGTASERGQLHVGGRGRRCGERQEREREEDLGQTHGERQRSSGFM